MSSTGKQDVHDRRCFICGHNALVTLEEHHIVPRSIGGTDEDENLVTLCASCHRAISHMYNRETFARIWNHFQDFDHRPSFLNKGPPLTGLTYGETNELEVDDEEVIERVKQAYVLLEETGLSKRKIAAKLDFKLNFIHHLPERREKYEQVIEIPNGDQTTLSKEWFSKIEEGNTSA